MNHKDIDTQTFKKVFEENKHHLLDVRTPEEFKAGHIKGALNIDFYAETFEDEIDKLDKEKKYLVYCRSGNRSRKTMLMMRELGFDEVHNLEEGIISWHQHGFDIEK